MHLGAGHCEPWCPEPTHWMGIQQLKKKVFCGPLLEQMRTKEGVSPSGKEAQQASEPWSQEEQSSSVQDPSGFSVQNPDVDGLSLLDVPQLSLGLSSVTERAVVGNLNLQTLLLLSEIS